MNLSSWAFPLAAVLAFSTPVRAELVDSSNGPSEKIMKRMFSALERLDVKELGEVWADDAVEERPLAVVESARRIEGRARIVSEYGRIVERSSKLKISIDRLETLSDPEWVLVEYRLHLVTRRNETLDAAHVSLARVKDGKIVSFRNYFAPRERDRGPGKRKWEISYDFVQRIFVVSDGAEVRKIPAVEIEENFVAAFEVPHGIWRTRPPVTVFLNMWKAWPPADPSFWERQRRYLNAKLSRWTDFLKVAGRADKAREKKIARWLDRQETRAEGTKALNHWIAQESVAVLRVLLESKKTLPEWTLPLFSTAFRADPWAPGEFREIPAGRFRMGSPPDEPGRFEMEDPFTAVISKPFFIQSTHVTQADWFAVMGYNPSFWNRREDCPETFKEESGVAMCPRHPVETVSYVDAQRFVKRASERDRTYRYRLPTEAEWERAARGGTTTAFFFGTDASKLGDYAWTLDNSGGHPHEIATRLPNQYGLYDMFGNVWHWVADYFGPYPTGEVVDPKGPAEGTDRVSRGGAWNEYAHTSLEEYRLRGENKACPKCDHSPGPGKVNVYRSAYRIYITEDFRFSDLGFRTVRERR